MTISFDSIPITLRVPGQFIEFDSSRAVQGLSVVPFKALIAGQKTSAGTVAELIPTLITSADQARAAFGVGSQLANMIAKWRGINRFTELWGIAIDDAGSAVKKAGTITMTGTVTAAGTLVVYLGGFRVQVAVASGATVTQIATDLDAAIALITDIPFTSSPSVGVVTVTAKNGGTNGSAIPIVLNHFTGEELPAGLSVAIAETVAGATDIDLDEIVAAIGETQYQVVVVPWIDASNLTKIEAELSDRWGPIRQNDGHAFTASGDTVSGVTTLGTGRNSEHVTIISTLGSPHAPEDVAAAAAAQVAEKGNADPARPFQTLPLTGILAPRPEVRITISEADTLLHNGISTLTTDAGDIFRIERLITTYQTNAQGSADEAFLNVNTVMTLSLLRSTFRTRFSSKYGRHKLASDGTRVRSGQAVLTPRAAKAEAVSIFRDWESFGWVENVDQFKDDLIVERNAENPDRLDILLPPDLVNQLRQLGVKIQFRL